MTTLDHHSERSRRRIVSYIVSVNEEIERLNKEIEALEPTIHYDINDYRKYEMKIGAREVMKEQLAELSSGLRS